MSLNCLLLQFYKSLHLPKLPQPKANIHHFLPLLSLIPSQRLSSGITLYNPRKYRQLTIGLSDQCLEGRDFKCDMIEDPNTSLVTGI